MVSISQISATLLISFILFQHTQFSISSSSSSSSLTCSSQTFSENRVYQHCSDLPRLNSYLHWTYDSSKSLLTLAFTAPSKPEGWVAWSINPTSTGMVGAQSLIAFRQPDGLMTVKTYNISSYKNFQQGKIDYDVLDSKSEYINGFIRIYATIVLPTNYGKVLNQVWQVGPGIDDKGMLIIHDFRPDNLNSKAKLDLMNGQTNSIQDGEIDSTLRKKNIHGILNAVSWGIMFPVGAVIARYLRTFPSADPLWFFLHVFCQISAYIIGVAGWGTGLKLGSQSEGIVYTTHRDIGIALFTFATLQILAVFLKPQKDHQYRLYWNFYHHGLGYIVIILGIINVFKGLSILEPGNKWKTAYTILLIALAAISAVLEAITWIIVCKRKKSEESY